MQIWEHNRGQEVNSLCSRIRGYFCVTCYKHHHLWCPDLSKCWKFHPQTYLWDLPGSDCLCLLFKPNLNNIHPVLLVALGSTYCPAFLKMEKMGFSGRPSWSKGLETESRGKVRTSPDKTTNPYTVIRSMADNPYPLFCPYETVTHLHPSGHTITLLQGLPSFPNNPGNKIQNP